MRHGRDSCSISMARGSRRNSRASARSTAELTAGELDVFCKAAVFLGCSEDSYVSPSGAAAARQTATPARDNGKKTSPVAAPVYSAPTISTLLGTLGLSSSPRSGSGVTVAVIDSGIYPSPAFAGRIKAFYDFTGGRIRAKAAYDDYGHGTHVAGLIGGMQEFADLEYAGRGAERAVRRPQGAGQERRWPHQRRHPRDRVRGCEQEEASASTSSTCRSATRFSSRPRAIRSCRRLRRPRWPASSWSRPRATMASTKRVRLVLPASRRRATRRPR